MLHKKTNFIVVFVTTESIEQARDIANILVKDKLAACVNIIQNVESIFTWKGKTDTTKESLLIIKTKKSCFKRLKLRVKALHSYQVPEIIAIPLIAGNREYLDWIEESVK